MHPSCWTVCLLAASAGKMLTTQQTGQAHLVHQCSPHFDNNVPGGASACAHQLPMPYQAYSVGCLTLRVDSTVLSRYQNRAPQNACTHSIAVVNKPCADQVSSGMLSAE
jgi:hypothetical protein